MMAMFDNDIHRLAANFIETKYTSRADTRQKSMGLSYIEAEKSDLIREVAAFARSAYQRGRKDVLDAITYTDADGSIYTSKLEFVDLREFL